MLTGRLYFPQFQTHSSMRSIAASTDYAVPRFPCERHDDTQLPLGELRLIEPSPSKDARPASVDSPHSTPRYTLQTRRIGQNGRIGQESGGGGLRERSLG